MDPNQVAAAGGAEPNAGRFTFKNKDGIEFDVTITLGAVNRVDASDFSEVFGGETCLAEPSQQFLVALTTKSSVIAAVVWAVIQPQAKSLGISEEQFVESIDRTALQAMKEAFWGSLCDFFPDLASGLSQMIQALDRGRQQIKTLIEREAETVNEMVGTMVSRGVESAFEQLKTELGTAFSPSAQPPD